MLIPARFSFIEFSTTTLPPTVFTTFIRFILIPRQFTFYYNNLTFSYIFRIYLSYFPATIVPPPPPPDFFFFFARRLWIFMTSVYHTQKKKAINDIINIKNKLYYPYTFIYSNSILSSFYGEKNGERCIFRQGQTFPRDTHNSAYYFLYEFFFKYNTIHIFSSRTGKRYNYLN